MTLAASGLLVQWTDPMAIGAAVAAVVLLGVVAVLLNRGAAPSTGSAGASGAGATASTGGGQADRPQPASTPQQLKQRAEQSGNPLEQTSGDTMAEMLANDEIDDMELLSQFVHDSDGETVGETMTVTEDEVIIKREGDFLAVDPESIIENAGQLVLDPNVDLEAAQDRGESWREANLDRMEYDEEGLPES